MLFFSQDKNQRGEMTTGPNIPLSYETILDHVLAGVVVFDNRGVVLAINEVASRLIGMDPEKVIGSSLQVGHWKFLKSDGTDLAPQDFPVSRVLHEKTLVREMVIGFVKENSDRVTWMHASATPVCDKDCIISRVVLSFIEISEQMKEQRLFLKAFDLSAALMAISTIEDGRYINVNDSFCEKTEYTREEVIGKTSKELALFVDYRKRQEVLEQLQTEGRVRNVKASIRTKSGRELKGFFHADIIVLEEKKHLLTVFNDITETFEALESQRKAQREWQQTFDGSRDAICLLAPDQKIVRCNRAMAELFKKPLDEITGKFCYEVVHGAGAPVEGCPVARMKKTLRREVMELRVNGRWFEVSADPILDNDGGLSGVVHSVRDISERIVMNEELRRSEERYRALAESSPEMIYLIDREGVVQYVNSSAARMFHAPAGKLIARHLADIFPPPVAERHMNAINTVIKTGKPLISEMMEPFPGGMCWIDARLTPVRDGSGAIIGVLGLSEDITERKRMEQELKKSVELYHDLVETAQDLIWQCDGAGRYTYLNPAWETVFGYKVDEMLGKKFSDFQSEDQARKDGIEFARLLHAGITMGYETVHRAKAGREIHLVFNAKYIRDADGNIIGTRGTAYDITERKRVVQALSESEQKYRALIEQNSQGVALIDEQGTIIEWNRSLHLITNIAPEAVMGKPIWEIQARLFIAPGDSIADHIAFLKKTVLEATRTGASRIFGAPNETAIRVNGAIVYVQQVLFPIKTSTGFRLGCILQDITRRKAAENALAASEGRLKSLYNNMAEGVALHEVVLDDTGKPVNYRIVDCNVQYEKILGIRREDVCGKLATEVYGTPEPPYLVEFTTPGITGVPAHMETYFAPMDKYFDISIAPWGKNGFATIFTDVTQRKKMEEELSRKQKMDALGVLAGGIAHDFNNLLAGMFGFMDLARESMKPGDPAVGYLGKAFIAFERAKSLSRQLLTFSKGGMPVKQPIRLPDILRECCNLSLSGSNVRCVFSLREGLAAVDADEHQLSQVFSNIMINARQAMPEGGNLTVSGENRTVTAGDGIPLHAGTYAAITIRDEGIGIPENMIDKVFDPFFTTKQQGSGLGLAICYSVIKKHGGHISVESSSGSGTAFTVWLPASGKAVRPKDGDRDTSSLKGTENILVMDDEPSIREMAMHILTSFGYSVVTVREGREAVDKYRAAMTSGKPFDLVILDLTVPGGMGGEKAIAELKKVDPDVIACVTSGYADNAILSDPGAYGFAAMIAKPYRTSELLQTVKEALGKRKDKA
jgi:two-component system cell cycle sensor histidine kinase/response regulator CckA